MNIFGFRPFKGKFNLGDSDDIPTNQDGTLIGSIKQINNDLSVFSFRVNQGSPEFSIDGGTTWSKLGGSSMKVIKRGTISATTTVNFPTGVEVDPENYFVIINTKGYYNENYKGGGNAYASYGYGMGAWDTDHTSTSVIINVTSGITCSYTIVQIAD